MNLKLITILSLFSTLMFSQSPTKALKKLGKNPAIFIDSVRVSIKEFKEFDSEQTALASTYFDEEAVNLIGDEGKDGVVYIESKKFSKQRYWRFFKSKSDEYLKIIPIPESDSNIQYILNKNILKNDFEGKLALIENKIFKKIIILSKEELIKKYDISDKDYGVEIISKTPKNLYKGKEKF